MYNAQKEDVMSDLALVNVILMIKNVYWILIVVVACSCSSEHRNHSYSLQTVDSFLNYRLDSDVKMPLFIRTCISDSNKEFLYFQNSHLPELLIYDMHNESLVKKVSFETEGKNAIKGGFLNGFMMSDCNHIYIAGLADCELYETDTTGCIKRKMNYATTSDGCKLVCCFKENGAFQFINGKLYLPQSLNWQLGEEAMEESALLCCMDTISGEVNTCPFTFPATNNHLVRGTSTSITSEYKYCFDGRNFVYSFAYMDDLLVINPQTGKVEYKTGKSQYIDKIKYPSSQGIDDQTLQRQICEYPAYGNIMYDSVNKVYYRIAYIPQEIEKDVNALSLLRSGRKQFSILIFDDRFNMIGEHLFPPYTYNPRLCFVTEGKLYISTNHVMNPDYSDDMLSFQQMELVKITD